MSVRPAKTQISLGIRPVWSESSLGAQWVVKDPSFFHADSEDSVQTGRMPRLICLRWAHSHIVVFVMSRLINHYEEIHTVARSGSNKNSNNMLSSQSSFVYKMCFQYSVNSQSNVYSATNTSLFCFFPCCFPKWSKRNNCAACLAIAFGSVASCAGL